MAQKIKRIYKDYTPEREAQVKELQAKIAAERPRIEARGRAALAAAKTASQLVSRLKSERERQGLSLADIQQRVGITRGAISLLENADAPNPTINTMQRYAAALGLRLDLVK